MALAAIDWVWPCGWLLLRFFFFFFFRLVDSHPIVFLISYNGKVFLPMRVTLCHLPLQVLDGMEVGVVGADKRSAEIFDGGGFGVSFAVVEKVSAESDAEHHRHVNKKLREMLLICKSMGEDVSESGAYLWQQSKLIILQEKRREEGEGKGWAPSGHHMYRSYNRCK